MSRLPEYHSFYVELCLKIKEGSSHNSYSTLKMVSYVAIGQLTRSEDQYNIQEEQLSKCLCKYSTELVFLCGTAQYMNLL